MAVLPSNVAASAGKAAAGARFRQRKISVKISLPIYNGDEISTSENDLEPSQLHHLSSSGQQPRDLHTVETGVDKNEEDEVHLQQVINAAQRVLQGSTKGTEAAKEQTLVYIPTPDASKIWPDFRKFYYDESFTEPESYIKFSATVEDTLGVEYNMDEVDELFFTETLLKHVPTTKDTQKNSPERSCSMLEFEALCDKFEKTIEEKQPFLPMDPSNIMSYKELSAAILQDSNSHLLTDKSHLRTGAELNYVTTSGLKEKLSKELGFEPFVTTFDKDQQSTNSIRSIHQLINLFGEIVYNHWRDRKIARKGKSIAPTLKFEDPNANEKENDNDPYVCFRRREFRQARKTRRADNMGAERIRLLQKSLKRAREIVLDTCKREILKLSLFESEQEVFKLRNETKAVKRLLSIKGDEHLFYAHKRKKIVKATPEDDEEEVEASRVKREKKKASQDPTPTFSQAKDQRGLNGQLQPEASSTQPYVKLPPSKIPDMDLVTVSLVLKEKNETIKRAVMEKLRKRKEHDKGFANITYDPYQPFFNIFANHRQDNLELSHVPYSSIAASYFHQFNTSNVISEPLKKLLEDGKKPLPGMKTINGATGEVVPSTPFPHLQSLLRDHLDNKLGSGTGYIDHLLNNMENNDFSSYTQGFKKTSSGADEVQTDPSAPIFRLRKRIGRGNQVFIDRKGLQHRPNEEIDEWLVSSDAEESDEAATQRNERDAYHHKADAVERMDLRWRFDDDYPDLDRGMRDPFSLDPSRLNSISDETQLIRFGLMLLSKSYDLLRESAHHRQVLIQQARIRALQQQQLHRSQLSGAMAGGGASAPNGAPGQTAGSNVKGAGAGGPSAGVYRKTTAYAGNKFGGVSGGGGGTKYGAVARNNYTTQQLQAMQQMRQQSQGNWSGLASPVLGTPNGAQYLAQKTPQASMLPPAEAKKPLFSGQRSAGEVGK